MMTSSTKSKKKWSQKPTPTSRFLAMDPNNQANMNSEQRHKIIEETIDRLRKVLGESCKKIGLKD